MAFQNFAAGSRRASKDLCIQCTKQPFDLTCSCGGKFDFNCINAHIAQVAKEIQEKNDTINQQLSQTDRIEQTGAEAEVAKIDAAQTIIDSWVCIFRLYYNS